MFGGKFGTLFKRTSKPVDKKKTVLTVSSTPQKTIDPVRIGDIGEHKVNIQLDQFPEIFDISAIFFFPIQDQRLDTRKSITFS